MHVVGVGDGRDTLVGELVGEELGLHQVEGLVALDQFSRERPASSGSGSSPLGCRGRAALDRRRRRRP